MWRATRWLTAGMIGAACFGVVACRGDAEKARVEAPIAAVPATGTTGYASTEPSPVESHRTDLTVHDSSPLPSASGRLRAQMALPGSDQNGTGGAGTMGFGPSTHLLDAGVRFDGGIGGSGSSGRGENVETSTGLRHDPDKGTVRDNGTSTGLENGRAAPPTP